MFNEPHKLKVWPPLFKQLWTGEKDFEYRNNDRNIYEGDELWLREYDPHHKKDPYTGKWIKAIIQKIWGCGWEEIPGLPETHVIMKIKCFDFIKSEWKKE